MARCTSRTYQKSAPNANCLQGQLVLSEKHPFRKLDHKIQDNSCSSGFDVACLRGQNKQENDGRQISHKENEHHLRTSIKEKYEPKLFQDIAGHEIPIKAISTAAHYKNVANLYLFYGPSGTGKTSTAKIFAKALNCETTSDVKPCWSCKSCSRGLCIMELCSGSNISGFERIRTLLQCASFTQAIPSFEVIIIEECHSLTADVWDEFWGIMRAEYTSAVFILITVDADMVPERVLSRCQKFFFPKLKDIDITLKLARIMAQENITIEREALKLIIAKAGGSLREAETVLDQLCLLETKITSCMVQQLVGLVSQDKLTDLLATAISGDNLKTVTITKELIATGVEPQALVSQLVSLITDILSSSAVAFPDSSSLAGPSDMRLLRNGSQITNTQSERLCHALKILVETKKQTKSLTDSTLPIYAALLQIASQYSSRNIFTGTVPPRYIMLSPGEEPNTEGENIHWHKQSHNRIWTNHQAISQASEQEDMNRNDKSTITESANGSKRCRDKAVAEEPNLACMSDIEELWLNTLKRIQSRYVKELLTRQVKLASVTITSVNAIVHLIFKRPEDKLAAQMSEESITRTLENAIGRHVTVNMTLETVDQEIIKRDTFSVPKSQAVNSSHSRNQQEPILFAESSHSQNTGDPMPCSSRQKSAPPSGILRPTKLKSCELLPQGQDRHPAKKEATATQPPKVLPFSGLSKWGNQLHTCEDPEIRPLTTECATRDTANMRININPKQRWQSLTSIQQSDASIEPYSQDILFENANAEKEYRAKSNPQHKKGFSKVDKEQDFLHSATGKGLRRSWSCSKLHCQRKAPT